MGTFRMYAGADQQAHIERIELKTKPDWLKGLPASQISFREWPAGQFLDWHPAPRRQFVIILSGQLEIGLGDGSKHVFGPGDARLVEDTTGKGHTTRVLGNQTSVTPTVPLPQPSSNPKGVDIATKIVFIPKQPDAILDMARKLTPPGFELVVVDQDTPEFYEAIKDTEYVMGLGRPIAGEFFRSAPKLKLVQLLSA